jgi:methylated-DNA-[protein]-cysteine S-methyltransferase
MNRTFYERCYQALKKIPKGKVTTYKDLASILDSRAVRAVGTAMKKNKNAPEVPCHRVIKSDGSVGEYAFGASKKIALLKKEGVEIENGKVKNLKKYLYKFKR